MYLLLWCDLVLVGCFDDGFCVVYWIVGCCVYVGIVVEVVCMWVDFCVVDCDVGDVVVVVGEWCF